MVLNSVQLVGLAGLELRCRPLRRPGLDLEAGEAGGDGAGEFDGHAAVEDEGFCGCEAGEVGEEDEDGVAG